MNLSLQNQIERGSTPEPNSGCWLWDGSLGSNGSGYGSLWIKSAQKRVPAHRASYTAFFGDIPDGKVVMHRCDTRSCVNPDHLSLGSYRDNAIDAHRKCRTKFSRATKEQRQAWARQPSTSGLAASVGLSLIERIDRMSTPEPNTGCFLWAGPQTKDGYGKIKVKGQMRLAHRVSYAENVEPIPAKMFVLHKCDTPSCVNPAHLSVGTPLDNCRDAANKKRNHFAGASREKRIEWARKRIARENQEPGLRREMNRKGWEVRHANEQAAREAREAREARLVLINLFKGLQ